MISHFLSPTIQGKLSRQPRRQLLHSTSSYLIQLTSMFDQAFLSTLHYLPRSIGNPKGLLDHLVGLRPFRSFALHRASWIPHYTGLPPSHKTGRPRLCSFIHRQYYLVAIESWSWSLHQRDRALLYLASCIFCYHYSCK